MHLRMPYTYSPDNDSCMRSRVTMLRLGALEPSATGCLLGEPRAPRRRFVRASSTGAGREALSFRSLPGSACDSDLPRHVEILSPSTRSRDLKEKKDVYAKNGVEECWIIDPRARSLTVFSRADDTFDDGTTVTQGPLPSRLLPDLDAAVEQLLDY